MRSFNIKKSSSSFLFFTVLFFCTALLANAQELRPFSNKKGQTLRGYVLAVKGDKVQIKRADGKNLTLSIDIFNQETQEYIRSWKAPALTPQNTKLSIKSTRMRLDRKRFEEGILNIIAETIGYKIEIKNSSSNILENLTLRYRIYYRKIDFGTVKRGGSVEFKETQQHINSIPAMKTTEVITEGVPIRKQKTDSNWTMNGDKNATDKLLGIWVRIYSGNTLLFEEVLDRKKIPFWKKDQNTKKETSAIEATGNEIK